jgi:hypothetical protein
MAGVLALLVVAVYPGTVDAIVIYDDSQQVRRESHDPFLFAPALSRVGLNADACGLTSYQADANNFLISDGQASEPSEYGAGLNGGAFPSVGRLLRDGDSRSGLELSGLNSDAYLADSTFPILSQIETRMANIGNCLSYMQYLLRTIGVIFNFYNESLNTGFGGSSGGNIVSNPYTFVFNAAGNAAASSPSSAEAVTQAIAVSKYASKFRLRNTLTTLMNENRSRLIRNSSGRAGASIYSASQASASSPKKSTKRGAGGLKYTLKRFLIEIFTQAYTYVLITVILGFSLFLRSRV